MDTLSQLKIILCGVLQTEDIQHSFSVNTPLLNAIPGFDSMAVVSIIAEMEERFGFTIADDEIEASVFETVGSLVNFVNNKLV